MKRKIIVLFALLAVVALCLAACGPSASDIEKMNDLFKVKYSKVTVVVSTKTAKTELTGSFALTFSNNETTIDYKFERVNTFEMDSNGNIADPDGDFIVTEEGTVVVRDGEIVDGDTSVNLPIEQLTVSGFNFQQSFFSNAKLIGAKFEADVTNPRQFTGNSTLNCSGMHVVVIRNVNTNTLTSMELTYTASNGAAVKINYVFTK